MASARKGTIVDERYNLVRKIGSGGMADVWLANDSELDRDVAIKILHPRFAQDQEFVERFRREASAAAGLQHPNVVGVFDRGDFRDTYYIAMEYVEGSSLKELITSGISIEEAIELARQVLAAARFAHKKGIVHRDMKPQNVLIDGDGRARVADFGIARAGTSEITQTGSVMGTAQYLSPEQAQGKDVTLASDIYSIGVMLYEALTGTVPFEADSAVAVALKQVQETPKRPSSLNPEVSPALDAVVMRALAKDPERRFIDAGAFATALDAAERHPDRPRPEDTAAIPAIGVGGEYGGPGDEVPAELPPRRKLGRWIALALLVALVAALVAFLLTRPGQVDVPNVIGQTVGEASAVLQAEGFDVDTTYVPRDQPRDTVLEQDPLPTDISAQTAEEGSTVILTVSAGPGTVRVPDVSGLSEEEATRRLEGAGFEIEVERRFSDRQPRGVALGTAPGAGSEIRVGSVVRLLISRGPDTVEVPSVVGLTTEEAIAEIEAVELLASVVEREDDATAGEVLAQTPSAGRRVNRGTQVTIFVSTGTVIVPNVIGATRPVAVQRLRQAGFRPSVREVPATRPGEVGRVIDQNPPGNSGAARGSAVTIFVGRATEEAP